MSAVDLGGSEWQLRGCLGDEWEWHVGSKAWEAPGWLPAHVPGSVLDDLVRAGEVPDPYRERNSRFAEWIPERAWVLRRRLSVPALREGARAVLRFRGVDYSALVFVDGRFAGRHDGMFAPFSVDVTEHVAGGADHVLAVVVLPVPESEPQVGRTSRVRVHKSRMGYGWDFCPRLIHQGIWRPVALHLDDPLGSVAAEARLAPSLGEGTVEVVVDVGGGVREAGRLRVGVGDGVGDDRDVQLGEPRRETFSLRVDAPDLWWPNGSGAQPLYEVRVELECDGAPPVSRRLLVGFRRVDLSDDSELVVNDRRTDLRGWNWVPLDALYGVPRPEKLARLLELAARANVNVLRVWGGGLIETEEFYDACDRLGLLVWQEFSQSSSGFESVPSDDPEFVAALADEARAIVPAKRHHACLAVWCGGNELADGDRPLDDSTPALAALHEVVRELDPDRAWLPTSPARAESDVHGPWEHQGLGDHNRRYDCGTWLLHSEFGVEGMTNRRALERLVSPGRRWPPDRSNPVYAHLGAWWNNYELVQEAFGRRLASVDAVRRASQWLQYDGLRYAVEANLRRSSGTIPWQLNESFPNAWCTAAVDYYGDPKPAYWGVARAYRPGHASASFARWAWGGESSFRARVYGDALARIVDAEGRVVADGHGEVAAVLDEIGTDVFLLDLESRNRYVLTRTHDLAPLLDLPGARLEAELADGALRLRHAGGPAAVGVIVEDGRPAGEPGWLLLEDNVVDLLPGEEREIGVGWRGCDAGPLLVEGWNAGPILVA